MVFDYRTQNGEPDVASATEQRDESPADETPDEAASSPEAVASSPEPIESETPKEKKAPVRLITAGVTIQVLNGTNDPAAGEAMAAELTGLGFQVVTVETTSKPYKETTVYWSFPDAAKAAEALAAKRDWIADEKPANLADTVSLHVVVGSDFLD